jgi:hypothetical protein
VFEDTAALPRDPPDLATLASPPDIDFALPHSPEESKLAFVIDDARSTPARKPGVYGDDPS